MRAARHFLRRFLPCYRRRSQGEKASAIPDPLRTYRLKLARAKEHLRVLQSSIDAFAGDPNAYTVTKENPKPGMYIFRLNLHREPPSMDLWALILGDCVHNIRSSLDHLFWALVLFQHPSGTPKRAWRAGFPIYDVPERFAEKKAQIEYFVGPRALAVLERLQPFNTADADNDALNFLNKSDVTDKHRLLIPSLAVVEKGRANAKPGENFTTVSFTRTVLFHEAIHDDAVLLNYVADPPDAIVDMDFIAERIGVVFNRGGGHTVSVTKTLAGLIEVAEAIPDEFPGLFPTHTDPGS